MAEAKTEVSEGSKTKAMAVQVPAMTMKAVLPLVTMLKSVGLPLSKPVLADKLGTTIKSSGFMQKIAAARYYGFVDVQPEGKLAITDRGQRFADGDINAAQEGFVGSAFGSVAQNLVGLNADESTVALHLTETRQVPKASAERLASTLLKAAKEAELMQGTRLDSNRLEELAQFSEAPTAQGKGNTVASSHRSKSDREGSASGSLRTKFEQPKPEAGQPPVVEPTTKVMLHLNTIPLTYQESTELINLLAKGGQPFSVDQPAAEQHLEG